MRLLFICTGNVCRSLMAERYSLHLAAERRLDVAARSCGIAAEGYFQPPPEVWRALAEADVASSPHRPQLVSRDLLAWSDEALAMTARQREFLRDAFPEHRGKISLLRERAGLSGDIADPIGLAWKDYRECFRSIREALDLLLKVPGIR